MLTRYSPLRLAVVATAAAATTAVVVHLGHGADPTNPEAGSSPTPATSRSADRAIAAAPPLATPTPVPTPAPQPSSTPDTTSVTPSSTEPAPSPRSTPAPVGPTAHPEPASADGRPPLPGLQQLAAARVVADATGAGRHRWPDLTGPVCCTDITVTGAATIDDDGTAATVVVTWFATALNGTKVQSATTTTWVRHDGSWTPDIPTPAGLDTPGSSTVAPAAATPAAATVSPTAATAPTVGTTGVAKPLLSSRFSTARPGDNRHTPLTTPCESLATSVWWGYDQIKSAEGAPMSSCRWRLT